MMLRQMSGVSGISGSAVEKARKGAYSRLEVNRGLSARRLLDNFTQQAGDEWRVNDAVRSPVHSRKRTC
jgi:chemotaxis methyl-accepting protein methylase